MRNYLLLLKVIKWMKDLKSLCLLALLPLGMQAQTSAGDSVLNHKGDSRLSVGGYGEVTYSRNYFSDHVSRYSQPEEHKNDPSHGHSIDFI